MFLLTPGGNAHGLNTLRIKELHRFRRRSIFLPKSPFWPRSGRLPPIRPTNQLRERQGPGALRHPSKTRRHVGSPDDIRAPTAAGPINLGDPAPAAARLAFASRSYRTARQLVPKRHAGRPGFLVSMSLHPPTAPRPGRDAGFASHTELPRRVGSIPTYLVYDNLAARLRLANPDRGHILLPITGRWRGATREQVGKFPAQLLIGQPHPDSFNMLGWNRFQRPRAGYRSDDRTNPHGRCMGTVRTVT